MQPTYKKFNNLYVAVVVANIAVFAAGHHYGWSSPAIPILQANFHINTSEESWIGSLVAFGSIFGPFLGGWLADLIGRRCTLWVSMSLCLLSWGILYLTKTMWVMYGSRLLGGVGGGMVFTVLPMYVGEISEDKVRGALSSLLGFFFISGIILEYLVGPYVSYENLILVNCISPITFLLLSLCIPESPFFLVLQNQEFEAYHSLLWLRQSPSQEEVTAEIKAIKEAIEERKIVKGSFLDLFRTPGDRRALFLSCGCMVIQQLSGINMVVAYAQTIFQMAGESSLTPSQSSILVALMMFAASGVSIPLIRIFGIRNMFLLSTVGSSVFQALLGLYFFLLSQGENTSSYSWLPVVTLAGYVIMFSFGLGPLPYAVMAEVYSPNVKGIGSAVTASCCWGMSFFLTKLFPIVAKSLGIHFVFWSIAVFAAIGFFFFLFLLPDTRGKSLQEIQDLLRKQ